MLIIRQLQIKRLVTRSEYGEFRFKHQLALRLNPQFITRGESIETDNEIRLDGS